MSVWILLWLVGVAQADVIPPDYVPAPPPACARGAQAAAPMRGHGYVCVASPTCETDASCAPGAHCEDTALCMLSGSTPIAVMACQEGDTCITGTCSRARRCVSPPPPPAPPPAATAPPATETHEAGGGCSASPASSVRSAWMAILAALFWVRARRSAP